MSGSTDQTRSNPIREDQNRRGTIRQDRTYLAVPFSDREAAKAAGLRWDKGAKSWYANGDITPAMERWKPTPGISMATIGGDPHRDFGDALREAGFILRPGEPIMDNRWHRAAVEGDRGKDRNGTYNGRLDGERALGRYQNHKIHEKPIGWGSSSNTRALTEAERATLAAQAAQRNQQTEREIAAEYETKAVECQHIWANAIPAADNAALTGKRHPYLEAKSIDLPGARIAAKGATVEIEGNDGKIVRRSIAGALVLPVVKKGALTSLQVISMREGEKESRKTFVRGAEASGGHYTIGDITSPWPVFVVEGAATGAAVHEATGRAVVVAYSAGNIGLVAASLRKAIGPDRTIIIAGDNDHHREREFDSKGKPKKNAGKEAALATVEALGGNTFAALPKFAEADHGTDWHDRRQMAGGKEAVAFELQVAMRCAARQKLAKEIGDKREREPERARERVPERHREPVKAKEPAKTRWFDRVLEKVGIER